MAWIQFPFPQCPKCGQFWVSSRHSGCATGSSVELDPDARRIRCPGCSASWQVWETTFHCSCGNTFTSDQVDEAIRKIIASASALARAIEQQREEIRAIRRSGRSSFDAWLSAFARGLGSALGGAFGSIANWVLGQFGL